MVSEEPRDDRCAVYIEKRDGYCERWPTKDDDGNVKNGRCPNHGGNTPTKEENPKQGNGEQSKNQNARKHGLHSTPEYLLEDLDETHRDTYHATFEALCSRYERIHGYEADFAAKKRISRISVEIVKEDLADEYLKENHSSHILIEDEIIDYNPETGPVEVSRTNKVLPELTALKRETRLQLKGMGLLQDPETKQADAMEGMNLEINVMEVTEENVDDFGD